MVSRTIPGMAGRSDFTRGNGHVPPAVPADAAFTVEHLHPLRFTPHRRTTAARFIPEVDSVVINLPDRLYAGAGKKGPVDEIRHEDAAESPFYSAFDRKLFMNE